MPQFEAGNPGRPKGTKRPPASKLVSTMRRTIEPYAKELAERLLERALSGNDTAAVAVMNVLAASMNAAAVEAAK